MGWGWGLRMSSPRRVLQVVEAANRRAPGRLYFASVGNRPRPAACAAAAAAALRTLLPAGWFRRPASRSARGARSPSDRSEMSRRSAIRCEAVRRMLRSGDSARSLCGLVLSPDASAQPPSDLQPVARRCDRGRTGRCRARSDRSRAGAVVSRSGTLRVPCLKRCPRSTRASGVSRSGTRRSGWSSPCASHGRAIGALACGAAQPCWTVTWPTSPSSRCDLDRQPARCRAIRRRRQQRPNCDRSGSTRAGRAWRRGDGGSRRGARRSTPSIWRRTSICWSFPPTTPARSGRLACSRSIHKPCLALAPAAAGPALPRATSSIGTLEDLGSRRRDAGVARRPTSTAAALRALAPLAALLIARRFPVLDDDAARLTLAARRRRRDARHAASTAVRHRDVLDLPRLQERARGRCDHGWR